MASHNAKTVNRYQVASDCCKSLGGFSTAALCVRSEGILQISAEEHHDNPTLMDLSLSLTAQVGHSLDDTPVTFALYPITSSPLDEKEPFRIAPLIEGTETSIRDVPQDNYRHKVL